MVSVSEIETDDIKTIVNTIPPKIKENVITTYTKLKEEGRKEGIDVGRKEGELNKLIQFVLNSFDNNITIPLIANITQLSEEEVVAILKQHGRM